MVVTLILWKCYRECFPLVCLWFLFVLAGIQPGVVLAVPAFCKLWFLGQCRFQSICSAILSASYVRDPEGTFCATRVQVLLCYLWSFQCMCNSVLSLGIHTDLGTFSLCHLSLQDFSLFSNPSGLLSQVFCPKNRSLGFPRPVPITWFTLKEKQWERRKEGN